MRKWIDRASYNILTLQKGTREVLLGESVSQFSYYESLMSPHITASLSYIDTGVSVKSESEQNQERTGTVFSALPIRGNELLKAVIQTNSGTLDFEDYSFRVSTINRQNDIEKKQLVTLNLCSEFGYVNENKSSYKKYYNNIGNNVSNILKKELGVPEDRISVESTKNSLAFVGSSRRPFDLIQSLATQSISVSDDPGFFFWETKDAFNFSSINSLISKPISERYTYSNITTDPTTNASNKRILSYRNTKNNELLSALRSGMFRTKNIFFNPYTTEYKEVYVTLSESGFKYLGDEPEYSEEFESDNAFTRTNFFILDSGNMEVGVSTTLNNDPRLYHAKSLMRYNLLFSQVVDIVVPCNVNLKAGDTIECQFPILTGNNPNMGTIDQTLSGKYLIMHLSHKFTNMNSTTHMSLVRDTYGISSNED